MRTVIFSTLVILSGCVAPGPPPRLITIEEVEADCYDRARKAIEAGVAVTYTQLTQHCTNPGIRPILARVGMDPDLIDLALAYRLKLAEARDSGEFSESDLQLMSAQMHVEITNELQRRALLTAQQRALQTQAAVSLLQARPRSSFNCTTTNLGGTIVSTHCR